MEARNLGEAPEVIDENNDRTLVERLKKLEPGIFTPNAMCSEVLVHYCTQKSALTSGVQRLSIRKALGEREGRQNKCGLMT